MQSEKDPRLRVCVVAICLVGLVVPGCRRANTTSGHRPNTTQPDSEREKVSNSEVIESQPTESTTDLDTTHPTDGVSRSELPAELDRGVHPFETAKSGAEPVEDTPYDEPQTIESPLEVGEIGIVPPLDRTDFDDWPRPDAALFVTGRQHGYIEPCGCTGLSNQKGGLARRYTLLQRIKDLGWPVVPVDVGNQVRRFGVQPQIKFQTTVEGLRQMEYRAVALGPDDLRLSFEELLVAIIGDEAAFVSADVDIAGAVPRFQIVEAAGVKIGITAILGESHQDRVAGEQIDEIVLTRAAEALESVWPELESAGCDLHVLLAHATIEESQRLGQMYPDFDVVVTAGGAGEPTYQPQPIDGSDGVLVQAGTKGMYAGILAYYRDAKPHLRYQRIALDATWSDSAAMLGLLSSYQQQLEAMGFEDLGLRPAGHPSGWKFVGSEKCGECHSTAYQIWAQTPHAHATETLVHPPERYEVPRHFDPECLSCHVTGWNPQGYFPYASGYVGLEQTAHLHGNGCENCHGPGSQHVAAEESVIDVDEQELTKLRVSMRSPWAKARNSCLECHDLDNSPDFHTEGKFDEYWKQIEHKGKD